MTDSVWYLVPALSVGGTERTLVELASGLDGDRYDVTVWTVFEQNPLADDLAPDVDHRTLGVEGVVPEGECRVDRARRPTAYALAPLRFLKAVYTHRPDVVQSFLFYDNLIARVAGATAPGTTVVGGVRCVRDDEGLAQVVLDRATLPLSDHVVSNSEAGARRAVDRGMASDDVSVVPNGRDLTAYRDATPSGVRDELGVAGDAPLVGTVGRLIRRKGHEDLLAAWPTVRAHRPDAHLVLVGDGPERASLEATARGLGVAGSVHFLGMREDVPGLLASLDVFAFPSHFEGLPGALIEAMAAGLPIVTTPVDGNAELVANYRTGLHVAPEAPDELAWALRSLLETPALAEGLGKRAQEDARELYSVDRMVAGFESVYESLTSATHP